ncbi:MAG: hypothetical protein ACIALR_08445, partial [Blastopirellula sp. JB062]
MGINAKRPNAPGLRQVISQASETGPQTAQGLKGDLVLLFGRHQPRFFFFGFHLIHRSDYLV